MIHVFLISLVLVLVQAVHAEPPPSIHMFSVYAADDARQLDLDLPDKAGAVGKFQVAENRAESQKIVLQKIATPSVQVLRAESGAVRGYVADLGGGDSIRVEMITAETCLVTSTLELFQLRNKTVDCRYRYGRPRPAFSGSN